jgi:glycosyltransferase involved in cell wall biosynthesis
MIRANRTAVASKPLASVVIPAHNEAGVIERCLDALFTGVSGDDLDVVVACNGCSDKTAMLARSSGHPVRTLELTTPSKPAALRAGDEAVRSFPRLYVDADVVLYGASALAVADRLRAGAVAARPPIRYDSSRSSPSVRSYYRARSRMPSVLKSLWGAGVYGLSAEGRGRFHAFPDVVADDLWIDRLFVRDEVEIVDCAPVVVNVPRRASDLVRVLRRQCRTKSERPPSFRGDEAAPDTTGSTLRDLLRVSISSPTAACDAATYAAYASGARLAVAFGSALGSTIVAESWERDDSSRTG